MDGINRRRSPPTQPAAQDVADLLHRARAQAMPLTSGVELRKLVILLEEVCERARVAAIRAMQHPTPDGSDAGTADPNCGFAMLFTALRRVRAEAKRRANGCFQPTTGAMRAPATPVRAPIKGLPPARRTRIR